MVLLLLADMEEGVLETVEQGEQDDDNRGEEGRDRLWEALDALLKRLDSIMQESRGTEGLLKPKNDSLSQSSNSDVKWYGHYQMVAKWRSL